MYKIKRFSTIPRSRGLGIERYFSEYLEQREYGLGKDFKSVVSNIRKSGLKDGIRKFKEGKLKELKDSLGPSPEDRKIGIMNSKQFRMKNSTVKDEAVMDNLMNEAKRSDAEVLDLNLLKGKTVSIDNGTIKYQPETSAYTRSKNVGKNMMDSVKEAEGDEGLSKFNKAVDSHRHVILHPKGSLTEELAHEIGHAKNADSLNPIHRVTSRLSEKINLGDIAKKSENQSGLLPSLKNYIKGKVKLAEENRATKKAKGIMKRSGMTDDQVNTAMKNLDDLKETYEIDHNSAYKNPLINKLEKDLNKKIKKERS